VQKHHLHECERLAVDDGVDRLARGHRHWVIDGFGSRHALGFAEVDGDNFGGLGSDGGVRMWEKKENMSTHLLPVAQQRPPRHWRPVLSLDPALLLHLLLQKLAVGCIWGDEVGLRVEKALELAVGGVRFGRVGNPNLKNTLGDTVGRRACALAATAVQQTSSCVLRR
jgi:hypothetical protein